jgi:hypothetical protein
VDVTIDESWQEREARGVDCFRVTGHLHRAPRSELRDVTVIDDDHRITRDFPARWVEQRVGVDSSNH